MKEYGSVRVVATKKGERKEKRRRNKFLIGEKLIRSIFDQSMILPNFLRTRKKKNSFVSLFSSHWPRPPPYAPWPKFNSDFHSENGPWYFMGRPRRPAPLPACDFGPSDKKSLLALLWGLKLSPLYVPRCSSAGLMAVCLASCSYSCIVGHAPVAKAAFFWTKSSCCVLTARSR
jgi:hypothetical protein